MFEFEFVRKQYYKLGSLIKKCEIVVEDIYLETDGVKSPYVLGTYFGRKNEYYSLTGKLNIPNMEMEEDFFIIEGYSSLTEWDNSTNPQIKLYINDELIQGLDVNHRQCVIHNKYYDRQVEIRLDIFSGREEKQFPFFVKGFIIDQKTYETYWDLRVAVEAWQALESENEKQICQSILLKCIKMLDFREKYSDHYYQILDRIRAVLKEELYDKYANTKLSIDVYAIGHTHIDLAWLWTFRQAIEKAERSFSTMLNYMEQYPNFTFIQSQPQLYQFVKENYPELYEKIIDKIREKRWFPEGAMWVESDTNLISGESLVRQFLYGKKFFKDELGIESKILWLPDVFGYSPALPQIMLKTNTPYFMTTKLSWNQMNQIPNDSFIWKGIDGSEVLVHMIPTISVGYSPTPYYTTYNGMLDALTLKKSWDRYLNKDKNSYIMNAYGFGDGGGGPTFEMLETAKRLERGLLSIPRVKNSSAIDFFERLANDNQKHVLNKWVGELYFEYHRGTYTSIAKIKKNNRNAEYLLQNIEKLYSLYNQENYPIEQIERLWKCVLKHQFHDVLPGSSIKEVYDEADKEYENLFDELRLLQENVFFKEHGNEQRKYVFNPNGLILSNYIQIPNEDREVYLNGEKLTTQLCKENNQLLCYIENIKALETLELTIGNRTNMHQKTAFVYSEENRILDTPIYRVVFDEQFRIVSLYHKEVKREIVEQNGFLNELVVYEDIPMDYDAWDIDSYYKEKRWPVSSISQMRIKDSGMLMFKIEIVRYYQSSIIKQEMIFYTHSTRIDFNTEIDWKEQQQLLRAEFDVDIHTYESTHDIQFGNITRTIHNNTSWDIAKFETCAHKWIDLSEEDYGCALLSDSKYGYNTEYKKMGISLIKSPIDPYPEADIGKHVFTYSLYPHLHHWKKSDLLSEGYALNNPLMVLNADDTLARKLAPISFTSDTVIFDTLKQSEDGKGMIIRLFETKGRRETIECQLNGEYHSIIICDLLENKVAQLDDCKEKIELTLHPYEIVTLKLVYV